MKIRDRVKVIGKRPNGRMILGGGQEGEITGHSESGSFFVTLDKNKVTSIPYSEKELELIESAEERTRQETSK